MIKKIIYVFIFLLTTQINCFAKDSILFEFPNEGWHMVQSPDNTTYKKCYVPDNQTSENYNQMLILYERTLKNADISAMAILHKQIGKDRNNYRDIIPEYVKRDIDDAMVTWCSQYYNTCSIARAFQGNEGVIVAIYINKMPHYSQNMFGQWSNILGNIKLYTKDASNINPKNIIEL